MTKTIKRRIEDLEAGNEGDQPWILACESIINPGVYSVSELYGKREIARGLTWDQIQERYGDDYNIVHFYHEAEPADDQD